MCFERNSRFEQAMEVDDDIFRLGIVDGALGGGPPRFLRRLIVGEQPDDVDVNELIVRPVRTMD